MRHRGFCIFLMLIAVFLFINQAQGDQVRIFKVQYRQADELLDFVKVALSETGSVTVDTRTNSLVVKDKSVNLAMVEKLLAAQDIPPININLKIHSLERNVLSNIGVNIDWKIKNGYWEAGTTRVNADGSFVSVTGSKTVHSSTAASTKFIKVVSGGKASLIMGGKLVANPGKIEYWEKFGYRLQLADVTHLQTGLQVEPTVLKGRVLIKITPVLTYFSDSRVKTTLLKEYQLETIVQDGQQILVGADNSMEKTVIREIFSGFSQNIGAANSFLLIEVNVEGSGALDD